MQYIYLTGVVDNGTNHDNRVPRNTATTIRIPQYASAIIEVSLFYPNGVPVDLTSAAFSGWASQLTISRNITPSCSPSTGVALIQKSVSSVAATTKNKFQFSIASTDFRGAALGRYLFDVWVLVSSTRYQVVELSALVLTPGLSQV